MSLILSAALIFAMRLVDVSLGTLRIGMVVRGKRRWAGMLGFAESIVWVLAARQVLGDLDEPLTMISYAAGYGAGTMFGATIERWLAMGNVLVRIVAAADTTPAYARLREEGFGVTVVNGHGQDGEVRVAFSVVPRRHLSEALDIVHSVSPEAFVTVEEAQMAELATRPKAFAIRK